MSIPDNEPSCQAIHAGTMPPIPWRCTEPDRHAHVDGYPTNHKAEGPEGELYAEWTPDGVLIFEDPDPGGKFAKVLKALGYTPEGD